MIRKLKPDDVKGIKDILNRTDNFQEEEIEVAMELVQIAISDPEQKDYNIFIYESILC